jgi:hypothetical protein
MAVKWHLKRGEDGTGLKARIARMGKYTHRRNQPPFVGQMTIDRRQSCFRAAHASFK